MSPKKTRSDQECGERTQNREIRERVEKENLQDPGQSNGGGSGLGLGRWWSIAGMKGANR